MVRELRYERHSLLILGVRELSDENSGKSAMRGKGDNFPRALHAALSAVSNDSTTTSIHVSQ